MSYTSMNYERFGFYKNTPATKQPVQRAGQAIITFTDMFGRDYFFPYRTKKQRTEISSILKMLRAENNQLNRILSDYSVKMGKYVNESKLRAELKSAFGFSKSNIDSILTIH